MQKKPSHSWMDWPRMEHGGGGACRWRLPSFLREVAAVSGSMTTDCHTHSSSRHDQPFQSSRRKHRQALSPASHPGWSTLVASNGKCSAGLICAAGLVIEAPDCGIGTLTPLNP